MRYLPVNERSPFTRSAAPEAELEPDGESGAGGDVSVMVTIEAIGGCGFGSAG